MCVCVGLQAAVDHAVTLSVSEVTKVLLNREVIMRHNEDTEDAVGP